MKKLLLNIILLIVLVSCNRNNNSEPVQWINYFQFVTREDTDLFISYPQYNANQMVFGLPGTFRAFDFVDTVNNMYRFGWVTFMKADNYLDYGNGDIDTLTISWEPAEVLVQNVFMYKDRPFSAVDKVTISFNGVPVTVWDFIADPGLRDEIPRRNIWRTKDDPDYNPYVIILPKDPDWDEIN